MSVDYGTTESFTITSLDGKAFVFNSIDYDTISATTIQGDGAEPFIRSVPGGESGTFTPDEGSRLVTSVTVSTVDFYEDPFDNVNVELVPPWMDVQGNGTTIVNGDTSPSSSDVSVCISTTRSRLFCSGFIFRISW